MSLSPRVLLVEDEAGLRLTLSDRLGSEGYSVETAGDGEVDRLARSTRDLQFHRPRPQDEAAEIRWLKQEVVGATEIARRLNISRASVYRV